MIYIFYFLPALLLLWGLLTEVKGIIELYHSRILDGIVLSSQPLKQGTKAEPDQFFLVKISVIDVTGSTNEVSVRHYSALPPPEGSMLKVRQFKTGALSSVSEIDYSYRILKAIVAGVLALIIIYYNTKKLLEGSEK